MVMSDGPAIDRSRGPLLSAADLQGDRKRIARERRMGLVLRGAGILSFVISGLIVLSLVRDAIGFLQVIDLGQLTEIGWFPRRGMFDVGTLAVASLLVTLVAMVIAVPVGIGAAIYLSEYAHPRARRLIKPVLEVLAGIPSVVLGFFALTVISPLFVQKLFTDASRFNLLSAGMGVGILVIPIVASISEDAMQAVPRSLREASYGLGARTHTTAIKVVIPAAISGIVAALILAFSRAIGETLVVTLAAGGSGGNLFNTDLTQPGLTMTAAMASQAAGTDQVKGEAGTFESLFFVGLLLFLITLALNLVANVFVQRVRQRY